MNTSILLGACFTFTGVIEAIMAKFVLPRIFLKNPKANPQSGRFIIIAVYTTSGLMLALAAFFFFVQPIT